MADYNQYSNALLRRHDQLKRWEESDTNKESNVPREHSKKIKFQDGCIFLAACSSGDRDEVESLLERGADINTANVDGLTALHQACIDDNLDMVEFLVDLCADINVCDNEGWTPLHATASCGFTEIARYLIKIGANISAVNNDGDLAIDICEGENMEKLLSSEMDKQGVDADAARREEEERMLADANQWLNSRIVKEKRHPKTGATSLHVAAAKGYIKVMHILFQAGVDINAKDVDGWTPLHAAAHWGQEETCKLLAEHLCDMEIKNASGQTCFDVADPDVLQLLEELKKKQALIRDKQDLQKDIIQTKGPTQLRRRSSVTRMSVDQKQNVILKTVEQERAHFDAFQKKEDKKSSSSSDTESEESESETEKQNEINRKSSQDEVINTDIKTNEEKNITDMPKVEDNVAEKKEIEDKDEVFETKKEETKEEKKDEKKEEDKKEENAKEPPTSSTSSNPRSPASQTAPAKHELYSRQISAPARFISNDSKSQVPSITVTNSITTDTNSTPSWRSGLRKTGSTSLVSDSINKDSEVDTNLPRSASSPRLAQTDNSSIKIENERPSFRRPFLSTTTENQDSNTTENKYGSTYGRNQYTPYRSLSSTSAYVPYYRRIQEQQDRKEQEEKEKAKEKEKDAVSTAGHKQPAPSSVTTTTTSSLTMVITTTTPSTTATTNTTTTNLLTYRRSYEPPKRDEETETQRKARAKRARETRRSTQGVTLEDVKKAEETLRQSDEKKGEGDRVKPGVDTTDDSAAPRRRAWEDRKEDKKDDTSSNDIRTSSSFRRSRESRELPSSTSDIQSSYIPRSQRVGISYSDTSTTGSSQNSISKSTSFRSRLRNGEVDAKEEERRKEELKKAEEEKKNDDKREPSTARARRARREKRRSTGIVSYSPDADEEEDGKEDSKKDEHKKEDTKSETETSSVGTRYSARFGSSSDIIPSHTDRHSLRVDRPTSYSDYSKSTPSLDLDYKKLYEEEKQLNEKIRRELEQVKKELVHSKEELDKQMKIHEQSRIAESVDKRDRRALERKVSEYEEELKKLESDQQRLKEENGALIRVISKLSK